MGTTPPASHIAPAQSHTGRHLLVRYSPVQNRTRLSNALISLLEIGDGRSELYAQCLSYFLLLHADQPELFSSQLSVTSAAALGSPHLRLALRVAGAVARSDVGAFGSAIRDAPLLAAACMIHLLPAMRATALGQWNTAYSSRELLPCK